MSALHFVKDGSGEPILFIQGIGVAGSGWTPQMEYFKKSYSVMSFDNRGIGKSPLGEAPISIAQMARDALSLMDQAGWEKAHIVGHSMGGVIAQQLALLEPERVKSLSLLCTFSRGREVMLPSPKNVWVGLQTLVGTRSMRRRAVLRLIGSSKLTRNSSSEKLDERANEYGRLMGRDLADSPPIMQRQMFALAMSNLFSSLPKLSTIPTLVVSASEDPIAPPACGRRLARQIQGSEYIEIPEASHATPIEDAELINSVLEKFLKRSDG